MVALVGTGAVAGAVARERVAVAARGRVAAAARRRACRQDEARRLATLAAVARGLVLLQAPLLAFFEEWGGLGGPDCDLEPGSDDEVGGDDEASEVAA